MPELPEVETIRGQLAPHVEGRRIAGMEILDPRWCAPLAPHELADAVRGRRVRRLRRRGKYLLWELEGELWLAQHLRMSGAVLLDPDPEPPHLRVRIELRGPGARKARLVVTDQRRFGTAQPIFGEQALEAFFASRLGPEPFDPELTAAYLWRQARGRRAPVKALLLDQKRVAGVGNIYADEALFRARIHPARPAGSLSRAQWEALRAGVIEALAAGIDAKGASIDDFRHIDGVTGSFQDQFLVHLRAGEPCPRCGGEIVKTVVAGRGTYVCVRCQRPPRGAAAATRGAAAATRGSTTATRGSAAAARAAATRGSAAAAAPEPALRRRTAR
jgi:formamidopyrimidine-DNA glycosylase